MQLLHLLTFLPLVFGAPASNPTTGCWVLDQIQTSQASGREPNNNNSTLSFRFIDPSTSTSTNCFATWPQMGQPEQYVDCSDPSFGWRFKKGEYQRISNFTLQLKHAFPLLGYVRILLPQLPLSRALIPAFVLKVCKII
jgi:hypothetical protein